MDDQGHWNLPDSHGYACSFSPTDRIVLPQSTDRVHTGRKTLSTGEAAAVVSLEGRFFHLFHEIRGVGEQSQARAVSARGKKRRNEHRVRNRRRKRTKCACTSWLSLSVFNVKKDVHMCVPVVTVGGSKRASEQALATFATCAMYTNR